MFGLLSIVDNPDVSYCCFGNSGGKVFAVIIMRIDSYVDNFLNLNFHFLVIHQGQHFNYLINAYPTDFERSVELDYYFQSHWQSQHPA
jgi:hypothetical protein